MKLISITGTKGKTTVARLLDFILLNLNFQTLRVDTDGHFVNGTQKSNYFDSRKYWGMVPNNCPGRFLYEIKKLPFHKSIAILETAIGSSSLFGLGYAFHDIGLITNIYEDHITKVRIKSRSDIFKSKNFIFKKLSKEGTFIFNADSLFLLNKLRREDIGQTKIAIGKIFPKGLLSLQKGDVFFQIKSNCLYLINKHHPDIIIDLSNVPITFGGYFEPNVYNVSFVLALLFALLGSTVFFERLKTIQTLLKKYKVDPKGGRLVLLKDKKKKLDVIIDFAHEKESFKQIASLAKKLGAKRVVGVLRMDPSRTREDIEKTAEAIHRHYDYIYLYDKIDGKKIRISQYKTEGKQRKAGETANIFALTLRRVGFLSFKTILDEKRAFQEAVAQSLPGDFIIYIDNGTDHKKSYFFVKNVLK